LDRAGLEENHRRCVFLRFAWKAFAIMESLSLAISAPPELTRSKMRSNRDGGFRASQITCHKAPDVFR
jgi:hypothetical protein